jgi:Amt family ammonium transporter
MECGNVSPKNRSIILAKNLITFNVGFLSFWLMGYGFGFGNVNEVLGTSSEYFASSGFDSLPDENYSKILFQYSFAVASNVVALGSMSERTTLLTYVIFTILYQGFFYPVDAAWSFG